MVILWLFISTENVHSQITEATDTHVIEITDLIPDTEYRIEAYSIADTGRESYNPTYRVKRTEAAMGGLSRGVLVVIVILGLVVVGLVVLGLVAICRYENFSASYIKVRSHKA